MSGRGVKVSPTPKPGAPLGAEGNASGIFQHRQRLSNRGYSLHEDQDDGTPIPAPVWTHRSGADIRADLIRSGALRPWVEGAIVEFCVHPTSGLTHLADRPYPTLRLLGCPAERPKGWRPIAEVER